MKVLQVPYTYSPDRVGGTEVYVESLVRVLKRLGVTNIIAAPGAANSSYIHNGVAVRRYATSTALDLRAQYGHGDPLAATNFGRILDTVQPDAVHLHAYSSAVSLALLREIHARGLPSLFTYHTPAVTCLRGNLLRWGREVCCGELNASPCTACSLHGTGIARSISRILATVPAPVGRAIANSSLAGPPITAMRMTDLVNVHHRALTEFLQEVDHVVVLCDWTKDILVRNGIDTDNLRLCRHGIDMDDGNMASPAILDSAPLRLVYFGRVDPIKGLDVLIRAIRSAPELPLELDVRGIVQADSGARHLQELRLLADDDRRIHFLEPVPSRDVVDSIRSYHMVVVPSQCLETGPLVVLESFAAGVPVLGSDLGGVAESVHHDCDGLLVDPPNQAAVWAASLRRLVSEPDLLRRLRAGVRPPRTMIDVGADMEALYSSVMKGPSRVETVAVD